MLFNHFRAAGVAALVTAGLLLLMASFLVRQPLELDPDQPRIDIQFLPEIEEPNPQPTQPVRPEPVDAQPPMPAPPVDAGPRQPGIPGGIAAPTGPAETGNPGMAQLILLSPLSPQYPYVAETRGIEGYTVVAFTVTAAGTVINARIVEAEPAGYFESASLKAINQARFSPIMENGKPIAVDNVRYKFTFRPE